MWSRDILVSRMQLERFGGIADFSPIGRGGHPQVRHMPVKMISQSFHPDVSQHLDFRASEWPGNVEEFRAVSEAIGRFVAFVRGQSARPRLLSFRLERTVPFRPQRCK